MVFYQRIIKPSVFVVLLSVLMATTSFADKVPDVISAPEVKALMERGDVTVIHVLSLIEYRSQHIPGSINIPIDKVASSKQLPEDKDKPVVFYCMGLR
mgnify:CR=1 FL=1